MTRNEKLYLKDITFECTNPKCSQAEFVLTTDYLNGYGELACPMCYTHDLRVVFLKYKKAERRK